MYCKSITYKDFDGNERKEDFYFHLSKNKITEMELGTPGGMEAYIQKIIDSKDGAKIMETFKMFITESYGIKSEDGRFFKQNKEITDEFLSSAAYDELFVELCTNAEKAAEFINGIIPKELVEEMAKFGEAANAKITALPGQAPVATDNIKPQ